MTVSGFRSRVAYIEHSTPCWPDIAARLRDEIGWDPVYWIATPAFAAQVVPRFPGIVFHSRYDANQMVSPPQLASVAPAALDEPYIHSMAGVQLVAMKMLDVLDSLDGFALSERARFIRQRLGYWKSIIAALRLDVVLFSFSPHTVYDYLVQEICRRERIRTVTPAVDFASVGVDMGCRTAGELESGVSHLESVDILTAALKLWATRSGHGGSAQAR